MKLNKVLECFDSSVWQYFGRAMLHELQEDYEKCCRGGTCELGRQNWPLESVYEGHDLSFGHGGRSIMLSKRRIYLMFDKSNGAGRDRRVWYVVCGVERVKIEALTVFLLVTEAWLGYA